MNQEPVKLDIFISYSGQISEQQLRDSFQSLRKELMQIPNIIVDDVEEMPYHKPGAKGDPVDLGLIIARLIDAGAIAALVGIFAAWLNWDHNRTAEFTIGNNSLKVTGLSKKELNELIEWFKRQAGFKWEK